MPTRNLELILVGRDVSASRALQKVSYEADRTSGLMGKLGTVMRTGLLLGAGAAAAAATASVRMAANFQQATTELVTGAGESERALGMVRRGLLDMSAQVGVSAVDLAKGLYNVESAGYRGARGLQVLKVAAEGAKVGAADMATVADAVTTALNAYNRPASDAAKVTNTLIDTVKAGKVHLQDLASSLGQVLPSAAALHVPFEQVAAAMATMTSQGTNAAKASTSLRFLFNALVAPTSGATSALKDMGLSAQALGDTLTKKGLGPALVMLTDAVGKQFPEGSAAYVAALSKIVGGTRGMQAVLELTGRHAETFAGNVSSITDQVSKAGGQISGWAKVQEDFNFKLQRAKIQVEDLGIKLGDALLPAVSKVIGVFSDFVTGLTSAEHSTNRVTQAGQRLAAFVRNTAQQIASRLTPAVDQLRSAFEKNRPQLEQIGRLLVELNSRTHLIRLAIGAWILQLEALVRAVSAVITVIGAMVRVFDAVASTAKTAAATIRNAWDAVVGFFQSIPRRIQGAFGDARTLLYNVGKQIVEGLKSGIVDAAGSLLGTVKDKLVDAPVNYVKGLLHVKSPSRVFMAIGQNIVEGLSLGIKNLSNLPVTRLSSLVDRMRQVLKAKKNGLSAAAEDMMRGVLDQMTRSLAKFQRIQGQLQGTRQEARSFAAGITGTIVGQADLVNMQGPVGTTNIIDFLTKQRNRDQRFRHDLFTLRHKLGNSAAARALIDQLASAGAAGGGAEAHALAVQASAGQLRTIVGLEAQIRGAARGIGQARARQDYGPRIARLEGVLKDIRHDLRHERHEIRVFLDGKDITAKVNVENRRRKNRGGQSAA